LFIYRRLAIPKGGTLAIALNDSGTFIYKGLRFYPILRNNKSGIVWWVGKKDVPLAPPLSLALS
jgi:hypothetical protein